MNNNTGEPVLIAYEANHKLVLNEEALESVLQKTAQNDVVIISIAGAYRKGKSFLLDFILRYLQSQHKKEWMGSEDEPLAGFKWQGGSERVTNGIHLWSEPFVAEIRPGEKVAILLMDTQGVFDSHSTNKDWTTVFALSTLISSTLIHNLTGNIQEDDLQHLQFFAEYGRLAMEDSNNKPFQNLQFLVRDWPYPYEYEYGAEGGAKLLKNKLKVDDSKHKELQDLRNDLASCFENMSCYLLPYPGSKVATSRDFNGKLSDIDKEFLIHMKTFVESLLSNSDGKKINGRQVKGKEIFEYFKAYVKLFQSDTLPEPKSALDATAEANHVTAIANAGDLYRKEMEKVCGGDMPYLDETLLASEHDRSMKKAMKLFRTTRKMGGPELSEEYVTRLTSELEQQYNCYMKQNASKKMFAGMETPVALITTSILSYLISKLLRLIGLSIMSILLDLLMVLGLVSVAAWVYTKYTGQYRRLGNAIDCVADYINKFHDAATSFFGFIKQTSDVFTKKYQ